MIELCLQYRQLSDRNVLIAWFGPLDFKGGALAVPVRGCTKAFLRFFAWREGRFGQRLFCFFHDSKRIKQKGKNRTKETKPIGWTSFSSVMFWVDY